MKAAPARVEVYREDAGGAYVGAKDSGAPCFHVYTGRRWWELYDFGPPRVVSAVPYGPQADREALGSRLELHEIPPRIARRIARLTRGTP